MCAQRCDSARHTSIRGLLENSLNGHELVGYSPLELSGLLRVVTHPGVFSVPTDLETALDFCWSTFVHLVRAAEARANIVPDAWFAALAIEGGCTWVTTDRDHSRFPGLDVSYTDH